MRIELSDVNQEEDVENDYLLKKVKKAALNCAAFLFQIVVSSYYSVTLKKVML